MPLFLATHKLRRRKVSNEKKKKASGSINHSVCCQVVETVRQQLFGIRVSHPVFLFTAGPMKGIGRSFFTEVCG